MIADVFLHSTSASVLGEQQASCINSQTIRTKVLITVSQ